MVAPTTRVAADEAAHRLPHLLDLVERGEEVEITRGERVVARLVIAPAVDAPAAESEEYPPLPDDLVEAALMVRRELSPHFRGVTLEELLKQRHAGHRFG